jgi:hypothetical protein
MQAFPSEPAVVPRDAGLSEEQVVELTQRLDEKLASAGYDLPSSAPSPLLRRLLALYEKADAKEIEAALVSFLREKEAALEVIVPIIKRTPELAHLSATELVAASERLVRNDVDRLRRVWLDEDEAHLEGLATLAAHWGAGHLLQPRLYEG